MITGFRKNDKIISGLEKDKEYLIEYKVLQKDKKAFKNCFYNYIDYLVDEVGKQIEAHKRELEQLNQEVTPTIEKIEKENKKELDHINKEEALYKKQLLSDEHIINQQLEDEEKQNKDVLDTQNTYLLAEFEELEKQALKDFEEQEAELVKY